MKAVSEGRERKMGARLKRVCTWLAVVAVWVAVLVLATRPVDACCPGKTEDDPPCYEERCINGELVEVPVPCPENNGSGNTVYYKSGAAACSVALRHMPDGSGMGLPRELTYASCKEDKCARCGPGWEFEVSRRVNQVEEGQIAVSMSAHSTMNFYEENGEWVYKNDGAEQDVSWELTVPDAESEDNIVLEHRQTGRKHKFHNFAGSQDHALLDKYEDRSGNSVDFVKNGDRITKMVDAQGREIDIRFNQDGNYTDIEHSGSQKAQFEYDLGGYIRKVNERGDHDGDETWTEAVHYFWYDNNDRLAYYVAPEQYDDLPETPTEQDVSAVAQKAWEYDGGTDVCTKEISGCAGCGGGGATGGVEFEYTVVNQDPATINTVYKKVEQFYPDDGAEDPSLISEVNEQGQLLKEKRKVDQSKTHLEQRSYTSDGKLEYTYHYDASDTQNPLRVTKYTYDNDGRRTKKEISEDGTGLITVKEWVYGDNHFPEKPTSIKEYENDDGTGTLQTDYEYYWHADGPDSVNGYGKVKKITYPQVNHNVDEAGGAAYEATREYSYDSLSRVSTVTNEDGMVTKYTYADADSVDNDGDNETDETDEWGAQVVKIVSDHGEGQLNLTVAEYEYDDDTHKKTKEKDALGNATEYAYHDDGKLESVTYPGGLYVEYTYDKNGNRTEEVKKTSAQGTVLAKTQWTYDRWGNVTEQRRFFDTGATDYAKTEYTYDDLGRVERVESYKDTDRSFAAVRETTYVTITRLPKQQKSGSTDGANDTLVTRTSYKYDVMGRRTETKDEVNNVTTTTAYDWRGRRTSVTGPEDYYVAYTYDNLGRVTETKRYDTNAQGTLLQHSKTYYDEMGRRYKAEVINPGDTETHATNYYYSKGGKLKKLTDPYSESTTYTYDSAGRRTKVTDALGNETVTAYYDDGAVKYTQQKNKIAAETYVTYSAARWYDDDRRLTDEAEYGTGSLPDPWPGSAPASSDTVHVTTYTLDKLGRATQVTDPEGMETTYDYDLLGRKTRETRDAAQGGLEIKTTWKYDQWDGVDEVFYDVIEAWEDAQNHQDTEYYYGAAKHPTAVTETVYPDSGDVTVAYNDDGTVSTSTDQRDWETAYTYDDAGRVTQESVTGNGLVGTDTVTYSYDALGRPTQVTDNGDPNDANDNSTVDWTYTREGDGDLKVEETQKYGNMTDRTVTYTYDLSGRLKTLDYPSNLTLTYTYDDIGRAYKVNDGTDDRVEDTWKGFLLQKREYDNGTHLTHLDDNGQNLSGHGYDTFGRIKNHRWKDSGGTLLAGWSYDYDRIGNKDYQEDLKDSTESELYDYDAVYRLTDFDRGQLNQNKDDITNPSRAQTWTLDPLGNWDSTTIDGTTDTRTHNSVNELTARTNPNTSLTYDDAGNLTQDGDGDGDHKYTWDYRNRLLEVEEKQSGNWNTVAEYRYDGRNRRILKTVTNKGDLNGTTRFLWGGQSNWQCLEERDSGGDLVARYTYATGYIDAVAVQERDLNGDDDEVVYYHSNTLYSVYALSDADENVVERMRYDAYGAATVLDSDFSSDADGASDVENPYTFTARRLDAESGLMQYRNRYYDPALGRFISRDASRYVSRANLYEYVGSYPTTHLDPSGLDYVKVVGNEVRWVTEKDGRLHNPDVASFTIGHLDGNGAVKLKDEWGGECVGPMSLKDLKKLASGVFLGDGFLRAAQKRHIKGYIQGEISPTPTESITAAALSGAAEGFGEGVRRVSNISVGVTGTWSQASVSVGVTTTQWPPVYIDASATPGCLYGGSLDLLIGEPGIVTPYVSPAVTGRHSPLTFLYPTRQGAPTGAGVSTGVGVGIPAGVIYTPEFEALGHEEDRFW